MGLGFKKSKKAKVSKRFRLPRGLKNALHSISRIGTRLTVLAILLFIGFAGDTPDSITVKLQSIEANIECAEKIFKIKPEKVLLYHIKDTRKELNLFVMDQLQNAVKLMREVSVEIKTAAAPTNLLPKEKTDLISTYVGRYLKALAYIYVSYARSAHYYGKHDITSYSFDELEFLNLKLDDNANSRIISFDHATGGVRHTNANQIEFYIPHYQRQQSEFTALQRVNDVHDYAKLIQIGALRESVANRITISKYNYFHQLGMDVPIKVCGGDLLSFRLDKVSPYIAGTDWYKEQETMDLNVLFTQHFDTIRKVVDVPLISFYDLRKIISEKLTNVQNIQTVLEANFPAETDIKTFIEGSKHLIEGCDSPKTPCTLAYTTENLKKAFLALLAYKILEYAAMEWYGRADDLMKISHMPTEIFDPTRVANRITNGALEIRREGMKNGTIKYMTEVFELDESGANAFAKQILAAVDKNKEIWIEKVLTPLNEFFKKYIKKTRTTSAQARYNEKVESVYEKVKGEGIQASAELDFLQRHTSSKSEEQLKKLTLKELKTTFSYIPEIKNTNLKVVPRNSSDLYNLLTAKLEQDKALKVAYENREDIQEIFKEYFTKLNQIEEEKGGASKTFVLRHEAQKLALETYKTVGAKTEYLGLVNVVKEGQAYKTVKKNLEDIYNGNPYAGPRKPSNDLFSPDYKFDARQAYEYKEAFDNWLKFALDFPDKDKVPEIPTDPEEKKKALEDKQKEIEAQACAEKAVNGFTSINPKAPISLDPPKNPSQEIRVEYLKKIPTIDIVVEVFKTMNLDIPNEFNSKITFTDQMLAKGEQDFLHSIFDRQIYLNTLLGKLSGAERLLSKDWTISKEITETFYDGKTGLPYYRKKTVQENKNLIGFLGAKAYNLSTGKVDTAKAKEVIKEALNIAIKNDSGNMEKFCEANVGLLRGVKKIGTKWLLEGGGPRTNSQADDANLKYLYTATAALREAVKHTNPKFADLDPIMAEAVKTKMEKQWDTNMTVFMFAMIGFALFAFIVPIAIPWLLAQIGQAAIAQTAFWLTISTSAQLMVNLLNVGLNIFSGYDIYVRWTINYLETPKDLDFQERVLNSYIGVAERLTTTQALEANKLMAKIMKYMDIPFTGIDVYFLGTVKRDVRLIVDSVGKNLSKIGLTSKPRPITPEDLGLNNKKLKGIKSKLFENKGWQLLAFGVSQAAPSKFQNIAWSEVETAARKAIAEVLDATPGRAGSIITELKQSKDLFNLRQLKQAKKVEGMKEVAKQLDDLGIDVAKHENLILKNGLKPSEYEKELLAMGESPTLTYLGFMWSGFYDPIKGGQPSKFYKFLKNESWEKDVVFKIMELRDFYLKFKVQNYEKLISKIETQSAAGRSAAEIIGALSHEEFMILHEGANLTTFMGKGTAGMKLVGILGPDGPLRGLRKIFEAYDGLKSEMKPSLPDVAASAAGKTGKAVINAAMKSENAYDPGGYWETMKALQHPFASEADEVQDLRAWFEAMERMDGTAAVPPEALSVRQSILDILYYGKRTLPRFVPGEVVPENK